MTVPAATIHDPPSRVPPHAVQFFADVPTLGASVAAFLAPAMHAGRPAVVILEAAHVPAVQAALRGEGLDPAALAAAGRLLVRDADELLAAFAPGDVVDEARFEVLVGGMLDGLRERHGEGPVFAYGEMVHVLWRRGRAAEALRLEEAWDALLRGRDVRLLCGYGIELFAAPHGARDLEHVCDAHGTVDPGPGIPRESAALVREAVRLRRRVAELEGDVARREALERRLREAERLEGIGLLAGGIAHDFNNLLAGVLANAEMLVEQLAPGQPGHASARDLLLAARRSAELSRQLLAYAGRARIEPEAVDLGAMARDVTGLLRAAVPAGARLSVDVGLGLPPVAGDRAQLMQVLMNLVTNGAEALPHGTGAVRVRLRRQVVDEAGARGLVERAVVADGALAAGAFVVVEVADEGVGMSAEVMRRIFDPFFTTKPTGRGLGLAAACGIVRAHGGALELETAPGAGTTMTVWLPAAGPAAVHATPVAPACVMAGPPRRVLVVDDEPTLRRTLARLLEREGLVVRTAADGAEAIAQLAREPADLVLLDLTMPHLDGRATLEQLAERQPDVPVVLMSGYTDGGLEVPDVHRERVVGFLPKPFERATVLETLATAFRRSAVTAP